MPTTRAPQRRALAAWCASGRLLAIEDIALATSLPHMTVLVPADAPSMRAANRAMMAKRRPVYLRTGGPNMPVVYRDGAEIEIDRANALRDGGDLTIVACGLRAWAASRAAPTLSEDGTETRVFDMHTIKLLDDEALERAARETSATVPAEEHLLGAAVTRGA